MLYDIWTVFLRDWIVLKRRLFKFMFSRMIAPMLYLVSFGWGLGRSVQVMPGMSYLDFLVPGIIALNSMNISFNSVGPTLHTARMFHKSMEEYLIAPIHYISFIVGKIAAGALRGVLSSVIITVLAYLFGARFSIDALFIVVLLMNCIIFSAIGFIAALTINSHEDMGSFNTYVLLPMSFLCGTFFKTDRLPELFRFFVELLPLTHTSSLLRHIGTGQPAAMQSVAVLAFYMAALFGMAVWAMRRLKE